VNKANKEDETRLFIACSVGDIEQIKQLLQIKEIDVNKADKYDGQSPLFVACKYGHLESVKLLLKDPRVNVNIPNKYDQTPLFIACDNNHPEIVKLLLKNKQLDVNKPSDTGNTPLAIACSRGNLDVINILLLNKHTNLIQRNKDYESPFFLLNNPTHHHLFLATYLTRTYPNHSFPVNNTDVYATLGRKFYYQEHNDAIYAKAKERVQEQIKEQTKIAAHLFVYVLFIQGEYLTPSQTESPEIFQFFSIAARLNFDLLQILCQRAAGNANNFILTKDLLPTLEEVKAELPTLEEVKAELPALEEVKAELPALEEVKAEFPSQPHRNSSECVIL
jgi:ankyrin repeat protein